MYNRIFYFYVYIFTVSKCFLIERLVYLFQLKIKGGDGNVTITNDGATILKKMQVLHPVAKMVCNPSHLHFL